MSDEKAPIESEYESIRVDSQNVPHCGPIYELLGFHSAEHAAADLWSKLKQAD